MLSPAGSRNLRHAKCLGKTYDFCKWTRPKSDPTRIRPEPVRSKPVRPNLNRCLPPFGSVFGRFCDRFGFANADASANACANASATAVANALASAHASAHASAYDNANGLANVSANAMANTTSNRNAKMCFDAFRAVSDRKQWNCYLIRATDGMSIDKYIDG